MTGIRFSEAPCSAAPPGGSTAKRLAIYVAVHEAVPVQVFGRRHDWAIHVLMRPATKERQGTKSRWGVRCGAANAMGIWPRRLT